MKPEDCRDVYGQFLRHTGYEVVEAITRSADIKITIPARRGSRKP